MRPDMMKVVTESPRAGGDDKKHAREYTNPRNLEDAPSWQPVSKGRGTKSFTDVLGPLRKFLYAQVGRKWDDVYSEVCAHLDRRTVQGAHIYQHIWGYVSKDVEETETGAIVEKASLGGGRYQPLQVKGLYICPRTGILKSTGNDIRHAFSMPGGVPMSLHAHLDRHLNEPWAKVRSKLAGLTWAGRTVDLDWEVFRGEPVPGRHTWRRYWVDASGIFRLTSKTMKRALARKRTAAEKAEKEAAFDEARARMVARRAAEKAAQKAAAEGP